MVNETEKLYLSGDTFVVPHLSDSRSWILDTGYYRLCHTWNTDVVAGFGTFDIVLGPFAFLDPIYI